MESLKGPRVIIFIASRSYDKRNFTRRHPTRGDVVFTMSYYYYFPDREIPIRRSLSEVPLRARVPVSAKIGPDRIFATEIATIHEERRLSAGSIDRSGGTTGTRFILPPSPRRSRNKARGNLGSDKGARFSHYPFRPFGHRPSLRVFTAALLCFAHKYLLTYSGRDDPTGNLRVTTPSRFEGRGKTLLGSRKNWSCSNPFPDFLTRSYTNDNTMSRSGE